ncbi:hypothetical protein KEM52_005429, partial [Ascosphaera acerosa]
MKVYQKQASELAMFVQGQRPFRVVRTHSVSPLEAFAIDDCACLNQVLVALHCICHDSPALDHYYRERLEGLLPFAQQLLQGLPQPPEAAFKRLVQLRECVLWNAAVTIESGSDSLVAWAVLCQFYCVALAAEPVFPEIDAMFSALVVEAMDHVKKMIEAQRVNSSVLQPLVATLMESPSQVLYEYQKSLLHWLSEYRAYCEPVTQPAAFPP